MSNILDIALKTDQRADTLSMFLLFATSTKSVKVSLPQYGCESVNAKLLDVLLLFLYQRTRANISRLLRLKIIYGC